MFSYSLCSLSSSFANWTGKKRLKRWVYFINPHLYSVVIDNDLSLYIFIFRPWSEQVYKPLRLKMNLMLWKIRAAQKVLSVCGVWKMNKMDFPCWLIILSFVLSLYRSTTGIPARWRRPNICKHRRGRAQWRRRNNRRWHKDHSWHGFDHQTARYPSRTCSFLHAACTSWRDCVKWGAHWISQMRIINTELCLQSNFFFFFRQSTIAWAT